MQERRQLYEQFMVLAAMGGDEQQQQVLARVHGLADAGQRLVEVVEGGQRPRRVFIQAVGMVHQADHAPLRLEARAHQLFQVEHLVAEHVLVAIAGKADHVQVRLAGPLRGHGVERLGDQAPVALGNGFLAG